MFINYFQRNFLYCILIYIYRNFNKPLPSSPPYVAYLGNLPQRITQGDVEDLFRSNEVTIIYYLYNFLEETNLVFATFY